MSKKSKSATGRRRNTVADNCLTKIEANYCGYYLKDGSFVVVAGGTGYSEHKCSLPASALQRNYTHTLTVRRRTLRRDREDLRNEKRGKEMNADKTIPEIFNDIFADFCGICESGLDFIKRQHEYQRQPKQQ